MARMFPMSQPLQKFSDLPFRIEKRRAFHFVFCAPGWEHNSIALEVNLPDFQVDQFCFPESEHESHCDQTFKPFFFVRNKTDQRNQVPMVNVAGTYVRPFIEVLGEFWDFVECLVLYPVTQDGTENDQAAIDR